MSNENILNITPDRLSEIQRAWDAAQPFHYVVIDDFLAEEFAEEILASYPTPNGGAWDDTPYIHQRKKLTLNKNFPEPIAEFFRMTESEEFRNLVSAICSVPDLIADPDLTGGGLHQIMNGGYLDVHVDYNFHPRTKMHRRLNLLLYLNKDWKSEYEGCLELWDMDAEKQIESIAPVFNRAVIFETNEVSYHGHPKKLNTPPDVTRKSLAVYYYTETRDEREVAQEHNTIFKQTSGISGYAKTSLSALVTLSERASSAAKKDLFETLTRRLYRKIKGLPRENK
jgi:Rps23 Pro-64 3,4-dihydroxylase Tpa1-like proline 4-hydroxylase